LEIAVDFKYFLNSKLLAHAWTVSRKL